MGVVIIFRVDEQRMNYGFVVLILLEKNGGEILL